MKKNDISTALGLILGFFVVLYGMISGQASIKDGLLTFWDVASLFITVFGSFFACMIAVPFSTLKKVPSAIKNAFVDKQIPAIVLIERFVELSKKARKEGLLSLEDEVQNIEDEFLKNGIQMVVDGIEPEVIKEIMELEISEMEKRHQSIINFFKLWGSLAPAFGMIGTLVGLIQMLKNLQDQSSLGPSMAVALITSFYGSLMANLFFNPLAYKLEVKSNEEANRREMMIEGVLAIQSGVNPRIVEDKLKTYLSPEERLAMLKQNAQKAAVMENE